MLINSLFFNFWWVLETDIIIKNYMYFAYFLFQSKSRQQSPLLNIIKTENKKSKKHHLMFFLFLMMIFLSSLQKPSTECRLVRSRVTDNSPPQWIRWMCPYIDDVSFRDVDHNTTARAVVLTTFITIRSSPALSWGVHH